MLPSKPSYLLRAPDASQTPFPEVLGRFTRYATLWVDLRPLMDLHIQNAYYREGAVKRDLASYLGTASARYQTRPGGGLRLVAVESRLPQHPAGQAGVEQLIPPAYQRRRFYRFFYEVLLNRQSELRGAVLLSAASRAELDRLRTRMLQDPGAVCGTGAARCAVFPDTCTVSVEMEIVVNGAPRTVDWGSLVASVAPHPGHLEMQRVHAGRLTQVEIDPADPDALRLPLLPGDVVAWN